jgi:hypothetical protein
VHSRSVPLLYLLSAGALVSRFSGFLDPMMRQMMEE